MKQMTLDTFEKVSKMDKQERILRLIHISVKELSGNSSVEELMELSMIQAIRFENGEIANVIKNREPGFCDYPYEVL